MNQKQQKTLQTGPQPKWKLTKRAIVLKRTESPFPYKH